MRFLRLVLTVILVLPATLWGEPTVVPTAIKQSKDYGHAAAFIERYAGLINSPKTDAIADSIRRIREEGFRYSVGNDSKLLMLSGYEDFNLSLSDYTYLASWSRNGDVVVACSFPANIAFLTQSSKIDLEDHLMKLLGEKSNEVVDQDLPMCRKAKLSKVALSNYYLSDNGYYITPRLKNQVIYEATEADTTLCALLIDTDRYQLETLTNMMLTGYWIHQPQMQLQVNLYGYKDKVIDIALPNVHRLFSDEGCTPYWGVDTFDGENVKGVYLWVNPFGGYAHMLSVVIPINAVSTPQSCTAKLHCYLRLDNLKSLFEEYESL